MSVVSLVLIVVGMWISRGMNLSGGPLPGDCQEASHFARRALLPPSDVSWRRRKIQPLQVAERSRLAADACVR